MAAPTIPASFISLAETTGAFVVRWGKKFIFMLAGTSTDDDQVGPDQFFDAKQVFIEPSGPGIPIQVIIASGGIGGIQFCICTMEQKVSKLQVRNQFSIGKYHGTQVRFRR